MNYYHKYLKYKNKYLLSDTNKNNLYGGNYDDNHKAINKCCANIEPCNKESNISGTIYLEEVNDLVRIYGTVTNLTPGKHGFHIHESADLTQCCTSLKAHYNPTNSVHGGPNSKNRHVGDLGNIIADEKGIATIDINDHLIKLNGPFSVIGRSLVIHQDEDDLGLGNNEESLKTGNAGKRIAYGIIGIY